MHARARLTQLLFTRGKLSAKAESQAVPGWLEVVNVLFTPCMSFVNQFGWRGAVTREQKKINTKINLTQKNNFV